MWASIAPAFASTNSGLPKALHPLALQRQLASFSNVRQFDYLPRIDEVGIVRSDELGAVLSQQAAPVGRHRELGRLSIPSMGQGLLGDMPKLIACLDHPCRGRDSVWPA